MQTEFIAVPPDWNVGQAIDYMRETADLPDRFYELYVVEPDGKFLGAVPLDRLLRTKRPVPIVRPDGRGPPTVRADRRPGGGGAAVRALQPGRGAGGR